MVTIIKIPFKLVKSALGVFGLATTTLSFIATVINIAFLAAVLVAGLYVAQFLGYDVGAIPYIEKAFKIVQPAVKDAYINVKPILAEYL